MPLHSKIINNFICTNVANKYLVQSIAILHKIAPLISFHCYWIHTAEAHLSFAIQYTELSRCLSQKLFNRIQKLPIFMSHSNVYEKFHFLKTPFELK